MRELSDYSGDDTIEYHDLEGIRDDLKEELERVEDILENISKNDVLVEESHVEQYIRDSSDVYLDDFPFTFIDWDAAVEFWKGERTEVEVDEYIYYKD